MTIRRAKESDISKLIDLLEQVLLVHHKVRPDKRALNTRKPN